MRCVRVGFLVDFSTKADLVSFRFPCNFIFQIDGSKGNGEIVAKVI